MAYSFDTDEVQDLRDAIEILESASKTPARSRTTKVGPVVDQICEHAYQNGLHKPELTRLIHLVSTRTELDQSSTTTLLKNLYPFDKIENESVTKIVNCLGQGKRNPAAATQVALVRWLTAVHEVLGEQSLLSRFYNVLFNLLDMISLRSALCQLLALITRRKHVRPFRIQRLLELAQQTANEPALIVLLRVYKNFYPEIILGATSAKIPQSQLPDTEWRQRLRAIQQVSASMVGDAGNYGGFRVARDIGRNGRKFEIPDLRTIHVSEVTKTLEEIQSATELVDHLEKIEAPSQIASALRDPLLQKYLQLGGSEDAIQRLEFWLDCYFEEELETIREGFGISASLSELLSGVTSYVEMSKIVPPIVEQFLFVYLPLWNGSSDLGYILDLMSYIPPQPFSELQNKLLNTLERSILNGAEAPFNVLFGFYSTLVQRWMSPASSNRGRASRNISVANEVHDLVQHVALLAESAVAAGQSTQASIISFYERVTDLVTEQIEARKQIMPAILPPRTLTYSLATSTTFSDFSRLCALLVTYKRCFERQGIAVAMNHESNPTDILNGYLMDVCNLIWRSRALNTTDSNAAGLLCSEPVTTRLQAYLSMVERDYSVHTAFDFSHGSLTAALAQTALSNLEGTLLGSNEDLPLHAGPVTQRSLTVLEKEGGIKLSWKHYRVEMLTWLEAHGLDGLKRLMFATMKDLMK